MSRVMMPMPMQVLVPDHLNVLPLAPLEQLCRPFSLAEILSMTHSFDESLVIGQGGFGKVYKGTDNGASVVAIKRLNSSSKQGDSEFRTEIEMLSKFRHSHIVSLIGYCNDSGEKILAYEYMVNGSLADHLYKIGKYGSGSTLSWVQRLKICLGAARGLDYLHTGTGVQDSVIHRDVKSSNILLDKNCVAKVSDFGLSRISPVDQSCTHVSTNVKGTTGYMDPEYLLTLRLTMKSDIYSFGVVLFEVLCGRRAVDLRLDDEQWSLARWAQHCIEEGTLHRIIDPNLRWEILPESLAEFERIASQCLLYQSKKRPTMTQVVASLELALALQLGHKDSSTFEMEMLCTSEADENLEKLDSTTVHEEAIKFGSFVKDNKDILQSHVKPTKRKALTKMLQSFMFWTVHEASVDGGAEPIKQGEHITVSTPNNTDSIECNDKESDTNLLGSWKDSSDINDAADTNSYLPAVLEEPYSFSSSEATDDDPLPAVEGLQISGEPFPGRELHACGYSINGTTSCNFEWVRHLEDGSVQYIDGAKQPSYLVSADDVETYLAIEVQPMDDRKRKGELIKVFANENRKITCDPELHKHIQWNLDNGHATYRVSTATRYFDQWVAATLAINQEGYSIKYSRPSTAIVTEKFSQSTIVTATCGNHTEFSIIATGGIYYLMRADESSQDITCSRDERDEIVLTMKLYAMRAVERKKRKKRGLFFHK